MFHTFFQNRLHRKESVNFFKLSVNFFKLSVNFFKLSVNFLKLSVHFFKLSVNFFNLLVNFFYLRTILSQVDVILLFYFHKKNTPFNTSSNMFIYEERLQITSKYAVYPLILGLLWLVFSPKLPTLIIKGRNC